MDDSWHCVIFVWHQAGTYSFMTELSWKGNLWMTLDTRLMAIGFRAGSVSNSVYRSDGPRHRPSSVPALYCPADRSVSLCTLDWPTKGVNKIEQSPPGFPLVLILITSEAEGRASFRWIWEFSQVERPDRPTDRPTDRPWRFSASYIFWTKLPIDKRFSASESHIQ